jgi:hypothetical protein
MKRFFIDFLIAFLIIILVFGMSENTQDNIINENYDNEIVDDNDNIENIKDYEGNLVNKISFKINGFIQDVCDFGFDLFKKALKSFLE